MVLLAALPPDLLTLLAALFLLLGVPAILFGLIMLYTGYVRYDGERYLERLEAADGIEATRSPEAEDESTSSEPTESGSGGEPNGAASEDG